MLKIKVLTGVFAICLVLSACVKYHDFYNVKDALLPSAASQMSQDDLDKAVIKAATMRGWVARVISSGLLRAEIAKRRHRAAIEIRISQNALSIKNISTENLTDEDGQVHRNYNRWVRNLESDIKTVVARGKK
ncbi:MAG: hypothetical protein WD407_12455 [Rhodospirillales bacterium]